MKTTNDPLEHLFDDIDQLTDPEPIDYEELAKIPTSQEIEFRYEYALEVLDLEHRVAMDWAVAKARYDRGLDTIFIIKDKKPLVINGQLVKSLD